jgi:AcrR family transcriptional regulator
MAGSDSADSAASNFPKLVPRRSGGKTPEEIANHQRSRIEGAMIEVVARRGYAEATAGEVISVAKVSKTTFYQLFESKEDCFFATFETITQTVVRQVGEAYRQLGDFRQRLSAATEAFMLAVVEAPVAASLVAVESLALGAPGVSRREHGSEPFEAMVRQSFEHSPSQYVVTEPIVRGIVAGFRGVVYRHLRAGKSERLPEYVDSLVDWALAFQQPPSERVQKAIRASEVAQSSAGEVQKREALSWKEAPNGTQRRQTLSPRERIIRAAAQLVIENGYAKVSIPGISSRAGVSNATFYEYFEGKREAFLGAFDSLSTEALAGTTAAFQNADDRPEAVGSGLRALLEFVSTHETFARIAFVELSTVGPVALDHADRILDAFVAFLGPPVNDDSSGNLPIPVIYQAIGSAIWAVIQHEIVHGRRAGLAEIAPAVATIAMTSLRFD